MISCLVKSMKAGEFKFPWIKVLRQIHFAVCLDRFSQLLRYEVALHFVNTWDIYDLTSLEIFTWDLQLLHFF